MAESEIIVTDAAQGVDCWMCEENEPHAHGRILTHRQKSELWDALSDAVENGKWMIYHTTEHGVRAVINDLERGRLVVSATLAEAVQIAAARQQ
jgi:hypothetical protein